jgi:membrane-associated phospholipid phosphatase
MSPFTNLFIILGANGPFLLYFIVCILLWNKTNLFWYYNAGIIVNIFLNIFIKLLWKEPRPNENPQLFALALKQKNPLLYQGGLYYNIFGMPSGHAQTAFFSTAFIIQCNKKYVPFFLLYSLLILCQRLYFSYHSLSQVLVGSIIGSLMGYSFYYLATQRIKNKTASDLK